MITCLPASMSALPCRRGLPSKVLRYDLLIGRLVHDPEAALCARHFRDLAGKAARIRRRHCHVASNQAIA
ncbi:hypothetical protein CHELA1G11_80002 [Hyphomicrobiales bacterium]|nr:hypothetical protein CHELA20_20042 [Hyphomicrobiales bacterium]CAH1696953.1 hypothetical protein CHELA1G11_80002 [Hyphomicrobiales bacterium]